jgi:organic radical activating enzyme
MSYKTFETYNTNWDARELFTKELMYRIHLVLNSDYKNPVEWFERLQDYFDFCSCCITKPEGYKKKLLEIDYLLFNKKEGNNFIYTSKQRIKRKELAYKEMRDFFRNIQRELLNNGVLMPLSKKLDPGKAVLRF